MQRVSRQRLEAWAVACLEKVGVPPPEAKLVASSLVQTSVWGIDSHGVLRLTHYLNRMTIGSISPSAAPVLMRTGPVTAQVHGQDGLGIVHATFAMEVAIEMAKENGAGIVGVGHSSHCGAMGLYTRMAARAKLIGIAMTHSSAIVIPHGGKYRYFGTNPISFAFPRAGEPFVLDMATSQVAWNKILNARIEGEALEEGIAVDGQGNPTTDAAKAAAGVPLGGPTYGYKGYGLAFMIDLLCGALNGMTYGRHINNMYEDLDKPRKIGHFLMAIDPGRFAGADTLEETVEAAIDDVKAQPGEILVPGDPELIEQEKRRVEGIPIDAEALADMKKWSARLGVPPPTETQ